MKLMLSVAKNSAFSLKQRLFSIMCTASKQVHKKPGWSTTGTADLNKLAKGIFHATECPSQYMNGRLLTGSCQPLKGMSWA